MKLSITPTRPILSPFFHLSNFYSILKYNCDEIFSSVDRNVISSIIFEEKWEPHIVICLTYLTSFLYIVVQLTFYRRLFPPYTWPIEDMFFIFFLLGTDRRRFCSFPMKKYSTQSNLNICPKSGLLCGPISPLTHKVTWNIGEW